jgi:hypothetical protein
MTFFTIFVNALGNTFSYNMLIITRKKLGYYGPNYLDIVAAISIDYSLRDIPIRAI